MLSSLRLSQCYACVFWSMCWQEVLILSLAKSWDFFLYLPLHPSFLSTHKRSFGHVDWQWGLYLKLAQEEWDGKAYVKTPVRGIRLGDGKIYTSSESLCEFVGRLRQKVFLGTRCGVSVWQTCPHGQRSHWHSFIRSFIHSLDMIVLKKLLPTSHVVQAPLLHG